VGGACVEHCRGGVRKLLQTHQVLRLKSLFQVTAVYSDGDSHEQELRTFDQRFSVVLKKLTFLQSFDGEEVLE